MWNHKQKLAAALALSCAVAGGSTAMAAAFSDVKGADNQAIVSSLQEKGIINGVTATQFKPEQTLTQPQALQILVNAFDLKADTASSNTSAGSKWYTAAVDAAKANDLSIPAAIDASKSVNREDFAVWLLEAINTTGQYPATKMFVIFPDQDDISPEASNAIQTLVNMGVIPRASMGQKFNPNKAITRMDAATWVKSAVDLVERSQASDNTEGDDSAIALPSIGEGEGTQMGYDPELSISSTADGKQKVKLSVQLPNPGYTLKIDKVELMDDKQAVIQYSLTTPQPGMMYPQVISEGTAETIIPAGYTAVLAK